MATYDERDYWRRVCNQALTTALRDLPPGLGYYQRRARLSQAYPFHERTGPQYRIWLKCLRGHCPPPKESNPTDPTPRLVLAPWRRPWWIDVRCPWCHKPTGCLICGPLHEALLALVQSAEWQRWLAVLQREPEAAPVVGDWLEEQGHAELGQQFRAEVVTAGKQRRARQRQRKGTS